MLSKRKRQNDGEELTDDGLDCSDDTKQLGVVSQRSGGIQLIGSRSRLIERKDDGHRSQTGVDQPDHGMVSWKHSIERFDAAHTRLLTFVCARSIGIANSAHLVLVAVDRRGSISGNIGVFEGRGVA